LADVDGRIKVKELELQSAEARLAGDKTLVPERLLSRDALHPSEPAITQAHIELDRLREERANDEASTRVEIEGLDLERGSLGKEATQARPLGPLSTPHSARAGAVTSA